MKKVLVLFIGIALIVSLSAFAYSGFGKKPKQVEKAKTTEIVSTETNNDDFLEDFFIIKEIRGTSLILARYDKVNGEYKEGLYSCDYGRLDGSDMMKFKEGEKVKIKYGADIRETYPMQMDIYEIHSAMVTKQRH